jgi:hypothetical protein
MVLYECVSCIFSSKIKTHYNRHLKTKKHQSNYVCSLISMVKSTNEPKMSTNNHYYSCDLCELEFSTKPNKRRHELHFCKENVTIKDLKIITLEKEKKKLEKKIEKLLDKVGTINNTTNNNTNNNTQNIIVVNNYGKENTNFLTVDKIKTLLDRPFDSVQELIKRFHYNSDHPENHNVKIKNKNEPYTLVWYDPILELRKKKSVVKDNGGLIDTTDDNMDESTKKYINLKTKFDDESDIEIINETTKIEG